MSSKVNNDIVSIVAILNSTTININLVIEKLEMIKSNYNKNDYNKIINGTKEMSFYNLVEINDYKGWCLKSLIDYQYSVTQRLDYNKYTKIMKKI
tara:strand:- start:29 stop:313 length:285 start_codon:yes stop_codon:yes gene_type:complete